MARATVQPIVKTEDVALAARKGIVHTGKLAKAAGILGYCFVRTLVTGKVTEIEEKPARRSRK
jgi:hypothetical protein